MKRAFIIAATVYASFAMAESTVTRLDVLGDTATFTLSEPKTHTIPSCVSAEQKQKWAINLNSLQGQAMYSLLVTAVSKEQLISVKSAERCESLPDVEQAASVSLSINHNRPAHNGGLHLYKSDGVTKIGAIVGSDSSQHFSYIPNGGGNRTKSYVLNENYNTLLFLNSDCSGDAYVEDALRSYPAYLRALDLYMERLDYKLAENRLNSHGNRPVFYLHKSWQKLTEETSYECKPTNKVASSYSEITAKITLSPHPLCGESACIVK